MKNEEGWRMRTDEEWMMKDERYDEGNDEGDDEGCDKVEWLILRCRDVGIADMPDIWWGFYAI